MITLSNKLLKASKPQISAGFIIAMLIISIILIQFNIDVCFAETEGYYLVKQPAVMEITTEGIEGEIKIPDTFYVKSTDKPDMEKDGVIYKYVTYNGVEGKVDSSSLSKKTISSTTNPHFIFNESLSSKTGLSSNGIYTKLYEYDKTGGPISTEIKLKFVAYAEITDYMFVRTVEDLPRIGFVSTAEYTPTVFVDKNPNPIDPDMSPILPDADLNPDVPVPEVDNANVVRIVLITLLCLLAVLIVFLIYKPTGKKKPSRDDFYEV